MGSERTLDLVFELTVLLAEDMRESFERDGLTTARAHLLWTVRELGPSTQRTLADALGVTPRNITGLVDALEAAGLVVRSPHPEDRRAILVSFTPRGSRLAARMARDKERLAEALFGPMTSAELKAFSASLDGVLGRLKGLIAAAR